MLTGIVTFMAQNFGLFVGLITYIACCFAVVGIFLGIVGLTKMILGE